MDLYNIDINIFRLSKNGQNTPVSGKMVSDMGCALWSKDSRKEVLVTDLEALVPKVHLLRKVEKVMDYEWLYGKLAVCYCHDNGRPGIDPEIPVVLIKMALIQHLFGIASYARHTEILP